MSSRGSLTPSRLEVEVLQRRYHDTQNGHVATSKQVDDESPDNRRVLFPRTGRIPVYSFQPQESFEALILVETRVMAVELSRLAGLYERALWYLGRTNVAFEVVWMNQDCEGRISGHGRPCTAMKQNGCEPASAYPNCNMGVCWHILCLPASECASSV